MAKHVIGTIVTPAGLKGAKAANNAMISNQQMLPCSRLQ